MVESSMTRALSNIPSFSIASLLLACLLVSTAQAEVPLRAFHATYALEKSNLSLATAELSLAPEGDQWRWRLLTRAKGFYAMLTRKRPFSETLFRQTHDDLLLQSILITEGPHDKRPETARFDWEAREMQVERKGKQKVRTLPGSVHDYQSIHLVAADMQLRDQQQRDLYFYRKGKIIDTRLSFLGEKSIEIEGKTVDTRAYQQSFTRTGTVINYYYSADNPLLPLLIERLEEDESPAVLTLTSVKWGS